jgi:hypothetical protein
MVEVEPKWIAFEAVDVKSEFCELDARQATVFVQSVAFD